MAETMKFSAPAYTAGGTERDSVELPGETFDGTVNVPVMHQAVKAFLSNRRQGNAATKTRGFVMGGNQKPWRQKGTGRARAGSRRAPTFVGGGVVFGPHPRSYAEYVPRQVRALARRSALNARARENAIFVIDNFAFDAPKTRRMLELLDTLGVVGKKVLILTDGAQPNVYLSARNIGWAHVLPYSDVSTYHVLWSDYVVIEAAALGMSLSPVAERERAKRAAPPSATARKAKVEAPSHARDGGKRDAKAGKTKRSAKRPEARAAKASGKRAGGAGPKRGKSAGRSGGAKSKGKPKGKRK